MYGLIDEKGIKIDYIRRNLQMAIEEKKITEFRLKRFRHIIESLETVLAPKKGKKVEVLQRVANEKLENAFQSGMDGCSLAKHCSKN